MNGDVPHLIAAREEDGIGFRHDGSLIVWSLDPETNQQIELQPLHQLTPGAME